MTGPRVYVIQYDEKNEYPYGFVSVPDWEMKLPEKIQDEDALRIQYVVEYNKDGDAELYKVTGWDRRIVNRSQGKMIDWTLGIGGTVGLSKEQVNYLLDTYRPGTELTSSQVTDFDAFLNRSRKPPEVFDLDGVLRKAMSLEDAKLAVSKFYHVRPEQVQINIIG
ncbi:hypothetical protein GE543_07095 [Pseudomonas sp. SZ57]|uniref:hypothetical protein n=1 Tax=Pseudomonas sp. SZ57 TaxID=2662259 RepID=UPI000CD06D2C|nr:hypothetical protein [Pseudomonas sp. SZ57]MDU8600600.1 hypothetical protein [Pseudomonas syringae]MQQ34132.1 hypothetical protein [Pseudomonas sp. SZ57]